jgi:PhnB protein
MPHPVPAGSHAITPHPIIEDASEATEFCKRAFGTREISRMPFPGPGGQSMAAITGKLACE